MCEPPRLHPMCAGGTQKLEGGLFNEPQQGHWNETYMPRTIPLDRAKGQRRGLSHRKERDASTSLQRERVHGTQEPNFKPTWCTRQSKCARHGSNIFAAATDCQVQAIRQRQHKAGPLRAMPLKSPARSLQGYKPRAGSRKRHRMRRTVNACTASPTHAETQISRKSICQTETASHAN